MIVVGTAGEIVVNSFWERDLWIVYTPRPDRSAGLPFLRAAHLNSSYWTFRKRHQRQAWFSEGFAFEQPEPSSWRVWAEQVYAG